MPGGVKGILGTLGTVAGLGALVTFLQSDTWKNLKNDIIPKLTKALETFKNGFNEFKTDFTTFLEDPSFANFTEIFTGESGGFLKNLAIITALLNPLKSLALLRLGVTGLIGGVKMFSRGLNKVSSKIGGGPVNAKGQRLVKNKAGRLVVAPGQKGAGKFAKAIPKTAFLKSLGKGILAGSKFIPGVGLAITAAVGIYDGLTAGIKEYKESGELGKSVEAGLAGAASGLTFGLVSQETFQKGIDGIKTGLNDAWNATTSAYDSIKTGLVAFYNDPKGTFLAAKAAITKSVSETATKLKGKVEVSKEHVESEVENFENKTRTLLDLAERDLKEAQKELEQMAKDIANELEKIRDTMGEIRSETGETLRDVESNMRDSEKDTRDTMKNTRKDIEERMDRLEKDLKERIEEALDNPLNDT